jgi:hypothetical protein
VSGCSPGAPPPKKILYTAYYASSDETVTNSVAGKTTQDIHNYWFGIKRIYMNLLDALKIRHTLGIMFHYLEKLGYLANFVPTGVTYHKLYCFI